MNFILKNPVILIIPALIIWLFASTAIIPIEEISILIPLILVGGFWLTIKRIKIYKNFL